MLVSERKTNPPSVHNSHILASLPVLATASEVDSWGIVSLSLALIIGGLALARALTSWWDLTKAWKLARVAGCAIAGLGFYALIFVASEAPPSSAELPWNKSYKTGSAVAEEKQRPMMVDFTAEWCKACDELEAEVFMEPSVSSRLIEEVVLVKVDIDEGDELDQKTYGRLAFNGLPAVAFLSPTGELITKFEGKIPIDTFLTHLDSVKSGAAVENENDVGRILEEKGLWAALLLAFMAGLLASLTPCVYPLIPITIGVFGAGNAKTKREGFLLSLVYVAGIAVTYTLLGVTAAVAGSVFGSALQNPWVLFGIASLFIVLGLSSMGWFEIRVPGPLQTKLSQTGGAGFVGAFLMGLVAGVVAAPCVGPIVAGILVYVAQQQDIAMGAILLLSFSLGMGQLFLLLGTFSSLISKIPTGGGWLDAAKVGFAALFWGVAIYYSRLIIPGLIDGTNAVWTLVG